MNSGTLRRIAPLAKSSANQQIHPAIVRGCLATSSDERTPEIPWEAPTAGEWRRAALVIAKQVAIHVAGYHHSDEFTRDGCQFAWDVFDMHHLTTRRDH
jgi:hypothetical protein